MATEAVIKQLRDIADAIKGIDKDKLLRPNLGEESLRESFGSRNEKIMNKLQFAIKYAPSVHDVYVNHMVQQFQAVQQQMTAQSNRDSAQFIQNRNSFLQTIDNHLTEIDRHWSPFVASAIEERGFLEDEGIKEAYKETIESIRSESKQALDQVKTEASKTIEEAKQLAKDIEERARRTAAKISVEEAQRQFREAQQGLTKQVRLWGILSGVSIFLFLAVAYYLASIDLPEEWKWHVIYYTAIRITILAAVGGVATFCLRIFRAHMHMSQLNMHRQRVANSIASFVESAVTPEQRDFILAQLVEAIITFGRSGLLPKEDDAIGPSKVSLDTITRTVLPPQTKS